MESMSFEEMLANDFRAGVSPPRRLQSGECQSATGQTCSLCNASALEYEAELRIKNAVLKDFWSAHSLPGDLQAIIPSPRGRAYRTVSKRKAVSTRQGPLLTLLAPDDRGKVGPLPIVSCAIEPPEHARIFGQIGNDLQRHADSPLAASLQYVIIKGNYREFTVILNVESMSGPLVKAANALSKALTRAVPSVVGFFLYEDESAGGYYLGGTARKRRPTLQRLFGKESIHQNILGKHFLFSPLSFSQVNLSIAETLVTTAGSLLGEGGKGTLYDLYCGYGLFAICLSASAGQVVGTEIQHDSIEAARENAKRNRVTNARFLQNEITADGMERLLRSIHPESTALLDPPRGGTAEGVIESIALRKLRRVVHIFCNIEIVAQELHRWELSGYVVGRVIPLDMFPGTNSIEIMAEMTKR